VDVSVCSNPGTRLQIQFISVHHLTCACQSADKNLTIQLNPVITGCRNAGHLCLIAQLGL